MSSADPFSWLARCWADYWFFPSSPAHLGMYRALFYAGCFFVYFPVNYQALAALGPSVQTPFPPLDDLGLRLLDPGSVHALELVWKLAILLSCLGLFTRASTAVTALLGYYLLPFAHWFGSSAHGDGLPFILMCIMACSRCGDAFSLDVVFRKRAVPAPAGAYRWPIQLCRVCLIVVFFIAGLTKFRVSGIAWAASDNLQTVLLWMHYRGLPFNELGLWLAEQRYLCRVLAASALVLELASPLALVSRRVAIIVIPSLLLFQVSNILLLGLWFLEFYPAYVFWLPLKWPRQTRRFTGEVTAC